ncbi:MAG: hypothetical protein ASARMPREDX12_002166 [Alectoria sarmentosa]|nr:MAG: hypothetical protein ASARMPREDX12_002166 [Alectoria sarmentosa]
MSEKKLDLQELDQILEKNTSELRNPLQGVSFSVFNNKGDTLYSKAYGSRTLEPQSEPLTTDTPIWTASLTKLVTTVACMIAVDQGLIGLDDNVREIVPELKDIKLLAGFEESDSEPRKPILKDVAAPISLRQLLNHTSGFTYDVFDAGLMEWSRGLGRTAHSHCGSYEGYKHPLIHEPGQGWAYGPGMDWAGRAVEILSGLTLEDFMQTHIFSPLSMHSTTFRPEEIPGYLSHRMSHATRDPTTGALVPGGGRHLLALPAQDCIGGMGLYSTPSELLKVLKEVLAGGGNIVKRESVAEMLKTQLNEETNAAFGKVIDGRAKHHLRQTWPEGYDGTFGLSASINLDDFPGRRSKDSMNWAGSSGLHAWIDPSSRIGGLLTTQLSPPGDPMFTRCLIDLETALYSQLHATN